MAVDDLSIVHAQLPEVFGSRPLPSHWDDWIILSVNEPESQNAEQLEITEVTLQVDSGLLAEDRNNPWYEYQQFTTSRTKAPLANGTTQFPGRIVFHDEPAYYPPPDSLAFYLPYHYYFPRWWGVYLIAEGVRSLARLLQKESEGSLSWKDAVVASRLFLYAHEAFHHQVESFATRLEITHRFPLYKAGIESRFQATYDTDDCLEEALANAKGYQRAIQAFRSNKKKQFTVAEVLITYIRGCPLGYNKAVDFLKPKAFKEGVNKLAEEYHRHALTKIPKKDAELWLLFPHAFSGISRINSRINYVINRHSPLAERLKLDARFLRHRELLRKLEKLAGCQFYAQGAKHEQWIAPNGQKFSIPRHPGDLKNGTVRAILKEAGVQMTFKDFIAAKP